MGDPSVGLGRDPFGQELQWHLRKGFAPSLPSSLDIRPKDATRHPKANLSRKATDRFSCIAGIVGVIRDGPVWVTNKRPFLCRHSFRKPQFLLGRAVSFCAGCHHRVVSAKAGRTHPEQPNLACQRNALEAIAGGLADGFCVVNGPLQGDVARERPEVIEAQLDAEGARSIALALKVGRDLGAQGGE